MSDDSPDATPPSGSDLWFNPYRRPRSAAARAMVADVSKQLQSLERYYRLRQRARRPADQEAFEATVSAICCDLVYNHLKGNRGGTAITRSNKVLGTRSRYRPIAYGKALPAILDNMARPEMDFIVQKLGNSSYEGAAKRTTIEPTECLLSRIDDFKLTLADFGVSSDRELIVLKRKKAGFWDEGAIIEYEDIPTTLRFREEIRRINAFLEASDIEYCGVKKDIDAGDRQLRRVFSLARFDRGGRLFGGFWQPLEKGDRLTGIRIDGQTVVGLDYAQMNPRIVYGMAKAEAPLQDAYTIPGLESYRDGVKQVFNAMLFATEPLAKFPKATRSNFPRRTTVGEVTERIATAHPAIQAYLHQGIGHEVQFLESQVLVAALLALADKGIVSLPVHDAIVVSEQHRVTAMDQMLISFKEVIGIEGQVKEEG